MLPTNDEARIYLAVAIALAVFTLAAILLIVAEVRENRSLRNKLDYATDRLGPMILDRNALARQVEMLRNKVRLLEERADRSIDQHYDTVPRASRGSRHVAPVVYSPGNTGNVPLVATAVKPAPIVAADPEATTPIMANDRDGRDTP